MKKLIVKVLLAFVLVGLFSTYADAQKRTSTKRGKTTTKKTTKTKTTAKVQPSQSEVVQTAAVESPALPDSLPIAKVKQSLRPDEAVSTIDLKDRTPLPYENLRADDAVFRHKIWREIDAREKINLPFRYTANESNGNQRFISILMYAIQDSGITVFSNVDDRFTTPMTKGEVAQALAGDLVDVPIYNENGELTGTKKQANEINLDSIYKFRIKEEVIFDKESSRLFWRILGIAPIKNIVTSQGVDLGETELFWAYYPDMRGIFSKYEAFNGKNYGSRMTWEELFESRMFSGRIIKSTMDNPYDQYIKEIPGLRDKPILQLLEGENIKEKIFNYEQDLWQY